MNQGESRPEALADFAILDTPSEEAFDDIVFIAAQTCRAPMAAVSLLDRDRQWFKARIGIDVAETPLDQSVCRHDIEKPGLLIIRDLTQDERTRDHPFVTGEPGIRFYAGAPLVSDKGVALGRLCIIDTVPRPDGLTDDQQKTLGALARQVVVQLEQKRAVRLADNLAHLQKCLIDVVERIRKTETVEEMTLGTAEIVGNALNVERAGYGVIDPETEIITIEPDWTAPGIASVAGTYRFADFGRIRDDLASGEPLIIDDIETDPRTSSNPEPMKALDIGALVNMPVRDRGNTVAAFIVQARRARKWGEPELVFLRNVADRLEAGVARHRAEQQQETLNHEISHRLKNLLAMVQAIASHTLRRVVEREPIQNFERRLLALSTAHEVLMQTRWSSAELNEVLDAVLTTFGQDGRIDCGGPSIALGPRASLSLSLLLHELMTNAIKYGALSNETGRVSIHWDIEQTDSGQALVVRWREQGEPAVAAPSRKGFGSKLIQLGLVGTGGVTIRYNTLGLEADMTASVSDLALS